MVDLEEKLQSSKSNELLQTELKDVRLESKLIRMTFTGGSDPDGMSKVSYINGSTRETKGCAIASCSRMYQLSNGEQHQSRQGKLQDDLTDSPRSRIDRGKITDTTRFQNSFVGDGEKRGCLR